MGNVNEAHACALRIVQFANNSKVRKVEISDLTSVLEDNFGGIKCDVVNWNAESWLLVISGQNAVNKNILLSKTKWSL